MDRTETIDNVIDQMIVDTSGRSPRYIVVSCHKKYIQISALAHGILESVRTGHSFAKVAQTLSSGRETPLTEDEVRLAYRYVLEKIQTIDEGAQSKQKNFWIKFPLLSAKWVTVISSRLTFLFHPIAVLLFLSSVLLLSSLAVQRGLLSIHVSQTPENIILLYLLFLFSLMAHEFGHASACVRGGVNPSEIGFTIYLIFPAFYSNVSASWQLSRWKKVRVDVGGLYFQLWVGVVYLFLYLIFGLSLFQLAFLAILSNCLLSLNPLARFDGYWIISDVLGVTNLSQRPYELMIYWYQSLRKKPHKAFPYASFTTCAIAFYGFLRMGIIISFVAATSPLLWQALLDYPLLFTRSLSAWRSGELANLLTDGETLGANSLFLLLWGMSLFFLSKPWVMRAIAGMQKAFDSHPRVTLGQTRFSKRTLV